MATPKAPATHRALIRALTDLHGARHRGDIERGVAAALRVWDFKRSDVEAFGAFCHAQYVPPGRTRNTLLARLDEFHEAVAGVMGMGAKVVRAGLDIADRPALAAENVLGSFSARTHLSEDYRRFRIAALIQLNFGGDDLTPQRTRTGWAARRIGDIGRTVIPAEILAHHSERNAEVDRFVSAYNLHLDHIDFADRRVRFPKGTKLISHWGLRDYMTSLYGQRNALPKQRAILDLMRRVVDGDVPEVILDDASIRWDIANDVVRNGKRASAAKPHGPLRWEQFRTVWRSQLRIDPHRRYGNLIDEMFLNERELPEKTVTKILTDVLSSPLARRIGRFLSTRLGRELEPFDIYYADFRSEGNGRPALRFDVKKRYPDALALEEAIPDVLVRLGWKRERAEWIGSKIRVDNSRSAGHAWSPDHHADIQLLRVRVDPDGCNELDFETYMHELGHAVEGVLSTYEMDYAALRGVPSTSFSEGFAFTFEDEADTILERPRSASKDLEMLQRYWNTFEIAGPALTEIRLFHWLYAHKNASAAQIMKTVRRIGDEVWAEYCAPIFGDDGFGLMSVYSHMLWCDFYLANYPLGYVIAHQVRRYLEDRPLPAEMERMCGIGCIYPQQWMQKAVGGPISVRPLLHDTRHALEQLGA